MSERKQSPEELEQSIVEVLEESKERMSREEITKQIYDNEMYCKECGKPRNHFSEFDGRVKNALGRMLDDHRIIADAQWNYRLP